MTTTHVHKPKLSFASYVLIGCTVAILFMGACFGVTSLSASKARSKADALLVDELTSQTLSSRSLKLVNRKFTNKGSIPFLNESMTGIEEASSHYEAVVNSSNSLNAKRVRFQQFSYRYTSLDNAEAGFDWHLKHSIHAPVINKRWKTVMPNSSEVASGCHPTNVAECDVYIRYDEFVIVIYTNAFTNAQLETLLSEVDSHVISVIKK